MKKVVIIGGGLGGLAAAIPLAHAGFDVTLFEQNDHFGGKLMPVKLGDHHFDFGPNTITMPQVFKGVFEGVGERAEDYIRLIKLDTHTRNHFPDGMAIDFLSDPEAMRKQLQTHAPADAERYDAFIKEITRLYGLSETYFFPTVFQSWRDYVSPSLGRAMLQVRPLQTMHSFFGKYFRDPHMRQALDRYATYVGSSPYKAPATFAMIAYLELVQGVYYAEKGNITIAEGFAAVARKKGAVLRHSTAVKRIIVNEGTAEGIELADGTTVEADIVILNGDLLSTFPALVDARHRPSFTDAKASSYEPSISAFVVTAGLNTRLDALRHHNVFFSGDYAQEFEDLFQHRRYSEEPTIYISNSSYTDPNVSPTGDNLFILANAPALTPEGKLQLEPEAYKERLYDLLETYGIDIRSHLVEEAIFTPAFIKDHFHAYRGALYGPSSHRKKDAFLRPGNAAKDIRDLYFTGGSTHPGGGSPMVVMSGQNLARRIIAETK